MNRKLIDQLAANSHKSWSLWVEHLFAKCKENSDGSLTVPAEFVQRWKRQSKTAYANLSDKEKQSDLSEAIKIVELINPELDRLEKDNRKLQYRFQQKKDSDWAL